MGGLYLREFLQLVAHIVAFPNSLGVPLDGGALVMICLCQVLSAFWRRALNERHSDERERAAATTQLAAALLAPLYEALTLLDPVTKSAGVFNLYLHAALVRVRSTVGAQYSTVNNISDDHIEGMIAELNRYFKTRTNNVSRGQSRVNKEALTTMTAAERRARKPTYHLIFTESIAVCPSVFALMPTTEEAFTTVARHAAEDPTLSVERFQCPGGPNYRTPAMRYTLPDAVRDVAPAILYDGNAPSMEAVWRLTVSQAQQDVAVCTCGRKTGYQSSPVADAAAFKNS